MIRAGELTKQVQIQRRSSTLDGAGEQLASWSTVYTRRAALQQTPGVERFASSMRNGRVPSVFKLRAGIEVTPADRVVCGGAVYEIRSVVPDGDAVLLVSEELVEVIP